jgi:hypothetical protein
MDRYADMHPLDRAIAWFMVTINMRQSTPFLLPRAPEKENS